MWLQAVSIKNFRALKDISLTLNRQVNVIVGPNAIGKSSILEAIRFVKGVFAPRTLNETHQVLMSLRAATPHEPQRIIAQGIAQDLAIPVKIECTFQLNEDEVNEIENSTPQISTMLVQTRTGFTRDPATFTAFIASPPGKAALNAVQIEIRQGLDKLKSRPTCCLAATIDFTKNRIENADPIDAIFFRFLEQRLPPHRSLFSYFPADRAITPGEQPIQIGVQDAAAQIESYNSQPHTKYARIKNSIFNSAIMNAEEREAQLIEFQKIFDGLLPNRKIVGPRVNQFGQLSIDIEETDTHRIFDIDSMSSGEKNLVLTWLLIARSISYGGIVMLDEPELHLNPAVCKNILPFFIDNYIVPNHIQAIICSHSPEILAGAFGRQECSLYHLRSGSLITPVRRHDREELTDALRLLGTSEVEGLLYVSTIFVEGEHDVDLLEEGFGEILARHKIKDLGGRREVEKQITALQDAERGGAPLTPRLFIFDKDNVPTNLRPSAMVKFLQWDRHCIENYLVDVGAMTDILKGFTLDGQKITNIGQVEAMLRSLAMEQLQEVAIRHVYQGYCYRDPGLRPEDIVGGETLQVISAAVFERIEAAKLSICNLERENWTRNFIIEVKAKREELERSWDTRWRTDCDGKKLFRSLQKRVQLGMPLLVFKKQVIRRMRELNTIEWQRITRMLSDLIGF